MIADIIHEIEEGFVATDLLFASTPRALIRRLEKNDTLLLAGEQMKANPDDILVYLDHAKQIFDTPAEPGYVHSGDLALAAYLFLLGRNADPRIRAFVCQVASEHRAGFRSAPVVAEYFAASAPATAQSHSASPQQTPVIAASIAE